MSTQTIGQQAHEARPRSTAQPDRSSSNPTAGELETRVVEIGRGTHPATPFLLVATVAGVVAVVAAGILAALVLLWAA